MSFCKFGADCTTNNSMAYWVIPCNQHQVFNLHRYLKEDNQFVDWIQNSNLNFGDIVFIYLSRREKRLAYKFCVESINIPFQDIDHNELYSECWINKEKYKAAQEMNRFVRLRCLNVLPTIGFSYAELKNHGLKSTINRAQRIPKETIEYILSRL